MNLKKINRAIISLSDKSNLQLILPVLKKFNIKIISSGGSYKKIKDMNYKVKEISDYTEFSEMLDGRVKTLHPKVYAGILNIRKNKKHQKELKKLSINNIDLVIVDLYPFERKISEKINSEKLIEYIDVGGPALIRAAAKNFNDVAVISNTSDYVNLTKELKNNKGSTSIKFRKFMAAKAFGVTAYYDSVVSDWLNNQLNINFPSKKTFHGKLIKKLRYGENPHQAGALYSTENNSALQQLNGKALSYNNYNDIYASLAILDTFKKNIATVIIKHANPCGVSAEKDLVTSFKNALACDPISAFGGIVGINSTVTKKLALELSKFFFEVIIFKDIKKEALKILRKKKNIRLVSFKKYNFSYEKNYLFQGNSFLLQDSNKILFNKKIKIVTKKKPTPNQLNSLKFAYNVCKFVKSNSIVLANEKSTIGIGAGQPSRLDSCKIAAQKAAEFVPEKIENSVAASDAFFPFADGIHELVSLGVKAIIQPGGSVNDKKVITAANEAGIVMAFTGVRHFKH